MSPSLYSDDTVIILAQALAGLGHLRVTHALYRGLPPEADPILLSSQDETVNYLHKLTSINPWLRRIFEFSQNGRAEDAFTWFARNYFRNHTKILEEQLLTIMNQRIVHPRTLVVVATHTFLAHQVAALKERFAKKHHVRIILAVIVTGDSPQHIWAVGAADLIVVPSEYCKRKLEEYQRGSYRVLPYMVSPRLSTELSDREFRRRKDAFSPRSNMKIHVSIPISGAAVQLDYFEKLIALLSDRFVFHIISHRSQSTAGFLSRMASYGSQRVSSSHREVVEMYESLYEKEVIAIEITKPSEQSFKTLLSPKRRGGAIMLFSDPVGRQEYDNLRFMIRHHLIPTKDEQDKLWRQDTTLIKKARSWRGLMLPKHSAASAQFIRWCHEHGIFSAMVHFTGFEDSPELSPDGVEKFWKMMEGYLS